MKHVHPNSMTYWWPRIKDCEVCVPYTYMVEWDIDTWWDLKGVLDGSGEAYALLAEISEVVYAYARHLIPPVFIRGCHTSGKHDWDKTCFFTKETLEDRKEFTKQLDRLIEDHECKFWLSGQPLLGFAIREFIPSIPIFYAFHGNLPITRERRLFYVKDEGIVCNHPYWPSLAIDDGTIGYSWNRLPRDWEEQLDDMNELEMHEERTLLDECKAVGRALVSDEYPAWSIDFLYGARGNWFFIDCATAGDSFHWENCPNKERFKRGNSHHLTNLKERSVGGV